MERILFEKVHWGPAVLVAAIAMSTTALSGFAFYFAQRSHLGIYSWFAAGSTAALIASVCAVAALYIYTAATKPALHGGASEQETRSGHVRNQLIMSSAGRKLHHETINFLNNIDMVVHGLKSETLSPRGDKILRLLIGENDRIKTYIQNYRQIMHFSGIRGVNQDVKLLLENVFLRWMDEMGDSLGGKGEIEPRFKWPPEKATVCVDPILAGEAFSILIDFMARPLKSSETMDIYGRIQEEAVVVMITHPKTRTMNSESIDFFEPFSQSPDGENRASLSPLFVARAIIEAHGGGVALTESVTGNLVFEVTLPLSK